MSTYVRAENHLLFVCTVCGTGVLDTEIHNRYHSDITDALLEKEQLQAELQRADLRAGGEGERCAAAVRVADAARMLHHAERNTQERMSAYQEFMSALELWESVR